MEKNFYKEKKAYSENSPSFLHDSLNGMFVLITNNFIIQWESESVALHSVPSPCTARRCLRREASC